MQPLRSQDTEWIKDLIRGDQADQQMSPETGGEDELKELTVEFMKQLRVAFTTYAALFNQMKGPGAHLRIYGLSGSSTDFMLFRGSYKMVFSVREPGLVSVQIQYLSEDTGRFKSLPDYPMDFIQGKWGAFKELKWTYNEQVVKMDHLIRYYMSRFVKVSRFFASSPGHTPSAPPDRLF